MQKTNLFLGHCLDVLKTFDDNSFDSIVTDPPYGLSFMGKKWDYDVPSVELWVECLRVLKPGGHLLAFAGTRTQHRMAARIEDAGFEIRDMIAWVYGSGFPKSHDVSKAIDKAAGAEREVIGPNRWADNHPKIRGKAVGQNYGTDLNPCRPVTAPATDAARQWQGWGTALKPALEPITVARKPLVGTVADNVLKWGTGGINVDASRVQGKDLETLFRKPTDNNCDKESGRPQMQKSKIVGTLSDSYKQGRFPANLIHDGSEEVVGLFPHTKSWEKKPGKINSSGNINFRRGLTHKTGFFQAFEGSAARFFYCPKATKADRNDGLDNMPLQDVHRYNAGIGEGKEPDTPSKDQNHHPTVKPTDLMRYLVTLVTPPDGHVLDPFMGSGSTGKGCVQAGFSFTGIEMDNGYLEIAKRRIEHEKEKKRQEAPLLEGV
jgi:DNA modification methylase